MTAGKVESPDFDRLSESRQILHEAKADRNEAQKTIHILTEQREDYRKQVAFYEGRVRGLLFTKSIYQEALENIARQKLSGEMDAEEWENADVEGGYHAIVEVAREALKPIIKAPLASEDGK